MKLLSLSLRLFALTLVFFGVLYPASIWGLAQLFPNSGEGAVKTLIGQDFYSPRYFWGRPSAVGYNAAATGGSNQGPTNPAHLQLVQDRRDTILKYHPYLKGRAIPSELVTASGGGLDPHLSRRAVDLQIKRVALARNLPEATIRNLVEAQTQHAVLGPDAYLNILSLNSALDALR